MKKIFLLLFLFFVLSCAKKEDYIIVSDEFVKNYYQVMNQEEAVKYTDMMAKDMLKKEIDLVKESRYKNPTLEANKAKVSFTLTETSFKKDIANITYRLTIQPKGSAFINIDAIISLKKISNDWKVINYQEMTAPLEK